MSLMFRPLIPGAQLRLLQARKQPASLGHVPLVRLYDPTGIATWLIAAADHDLLFGLVDLGLGAPEPGVVSLPQLRRIGEGRHRLRRDRCFRTRQPLSVWLRVANRTGSLLAAQIELQRAGPRLALARSEAHERVRAELARKSAWHAP